MKRALTRNLNSKPSFHAKAQVDKDIMNDNDAVSLKIKKQLTSIRGTRGGSTNQLSLGFKMNEGLLSPQAINSANYSRDEDGSKTVLVKKGNKLSDHQYDEKDKIDVGNEQKIVVNAPEDNIDDEKDFDGGPVVKTQGSVFVKTFKNAGAVTFEHVM